MSGLGKILKRVAIRSLFCGVALGGLPATAFVSTELAGHDVCLGAIRQLSQTIQREDAPPAIIRGKDYAQYSGLDGDIWKARLSLAPFPLAGLLKPVMGGPAVHMAVEFVPMKVDGHLRDSQERGYQIHGMAVHASDGSFAGLKPCDARDYYNQMSGGNRLKEYVAEKDWNRSVVGHDPALYVDLAYGTKEEMMALLEAMKEDIRLFNEQDFVYRFSRAPNSNAAARYLLDRHGLTVPEGALKGFWAPGFESRIADRVPETPAAPVLAAGKPELS